MKVVTPVNYEFGTSIRVWGWGWLGIARMCVHLSSNKHKTFWHVFVWKTSLGVSLPACKSTPAPAPEKASK